MTEGGLPDPLAGAGEAGFIDAGRELAAGIEDEAVAEELRAFVQQEAFHATVHGRLNRLLDERGLPARAIKELADELIPGIEASPATIAAV